MELLDKISALEEEASQFGFKWQSAEQIMSQIHSECDEIKEHLDHDATKANQIALQEEIGDLLHAVFSLCLFCKLSPRVTLGQSLTKFESKRQTKPIYTNKLT
jgi:ATP diphosphatase